MYSDGRQAAPYGANPYGQPYSPVVNADHEQQYPPQQQYSTYAPVPPTQQQQYVPPQYQDGPPVSQVQYAQPQYAQSPPAQPPNDPVAGAGQKLTYESGAAYKDKFFLIAFILHLVGIIIIAGVYGRRMMKNRSDEDNLPPPTRGDTESQPDDNLTIGLLVVAAIIGGAVSIAWLSVMRRFSSQIIHLSLLASIGFAVLSAIIAFAASNIVMGIFFLIIAGISALYYYFVRARIPFATAVLEASTQAIQTNSGPILVVYLLTIIQIGWLALWAFTFVSVYHESEKVVTVQYADGTYGQERQPSSSLQFLQFLLVLSFYWTMSVIGNIGHVTTSGVVASWWFLPQVTSPTRPAFVRATTTSLGSICFGSLLIAFVQTLRYMLRTARRSVARDIVDCLLACIETALKWCTKYALSVVAVYGQTFVESMRTTQALLEKTFFTAIINDDLSGAVYAAGAFVSGACAGIVSLLWAYSKDVTGYVVWGILGFIVAFAIAMLAMNVIRSAVTTTFVCWACDPAALAHNRPVEFQKIIDAGRPRYQEIGVWSGAQNAQGM